MTIVKTRSRALNFGVNENASWHPDTLPKTQKVWTNFGKRLTRVHKTDHQAEAWIQNTRPSLGSLKKATSISLVIILNLACMPNLTRKIPPKPMKPPSPLA